MSDPIPPSSGPPSSQPPPSPFDDPGRSDDRRLPPTRPGGSGVRKPLLIGCGVILLLVVGAMVYFLANPQVLIVWSLEMIHNDLESRLPEDLPDELRIGYEDAYQRAVASARENPVSPESIQHVERLQQEYTRAVQGGGARLSEEEVQRITEALEAFSGGGRDSDPAPDAGAEPEPEPEPDLDEEPDAEPEPAAEG